METGPSHLSLYVISGLLSYVFESQMLILTFFLILKWGNRLKKIINATKISSENYTVVLKFTQFAIYALQKVLANFYHRDRQ